MNFRFQDLEWSFPDHFILRILLLQTIIKRVILLVHGGHKVQVLKLILFSGRTHLFHLIIEAVPPSIYLFPVLQYFLNKVNHGLLIFKDIESLEFSDPRRKLHLRILPKMVHDHIDVHNIIASFDFISDLQFKGESLVLSLIENLIDELHQFESWGKVLAIISLYSNGL